METRHQIYQPNKRKRWLHWLFDVRTAVWDYQKGQGVSDVCEVKSIKQSENLILIRLRSFVPPLWREKDWRLNIFKALPLYGRLRPKQEPNLKERQRNVSPKSLFILNFSDHDSPWNLFKKTIWLINWLKFNVPHENLSVVLKSAAWAPRSWKISDLSLKFSYS